MPDCQLLCVHLLLRSAIHLNPFSRSNMINTLVLSLNSPRYTFRKFSVQQLAACVLQRVNTIQLNIIPSDQS